MLLKILVNEKEEVIRRLLRDVIDKGDVIDSVATNGRIYDLEEEKAGRLFEKLYREGIRPTLVIWWADRE